MKLTDLSIKGLKAPPTGQRTYPDDSLAGFGVRVSQGGTRSFVLVHGKSRERTTIGRYPIISLADARTAAKRILAERTLGHSRAASTRYEEALGLYISNHLKPHTRPVTAYEIERLLRRLLPKLRHEKLEEIETDPLMKIIEAYMDKPSVARHLFVAQRGFFRWCVKRRLLKHSPLSDVEAPAKSKTRERTLTDAELVAVYRACDDTAHGNIVRLLALTGQRRGQIAGLHSTFIDHKAQVITWPAAMMKNNRPHFLPITPMVAAILATLPKEGILFPARGKATPFNGFPTSKRAFDKRLEGVAPWTLHDLRRTFSTGLATLRVLPHIKEMLLAHSSAKNPVEAIYDRYLYLDEQRQALLAWEAKLQTLLSNTESTNGGALDPRRDTSIHDQTAGDAVEGARGHLRRATGA
jgi:integrase